MAKRVRLCPEITDPELRGFLDMVPSVRKYMRGIIDDSLLKGEKTSITLKERELTVYIHRAEGKNRPVVFEMHGGGFILGDAEKDDSICESIKENADVNVVGINYRLSPEFPYPAPLDDVYDTILFFKKHAAEYGFDMEKIGLIGFSAGATLAAAISLRSKKSGDFNVTAQALHYPYLDSTRMPSEKKHYDVDMDAAVMKSFTELYSKKEERALSYVSPIMAKREELEGTAATLILTADRDALKDEGLEYGEHLRAAGVDTYAAAIPGTHHGYIEDAAHEPSYEVSDMNKRKLHDPYFRVWAKTALEISADFFTRRFEKE
ncbi:MAG: alpha/beta hydrolase [Lachnospiraceae bacterium]|nr:alpha/beta hydrolase [Lachnospiraceae bacterium]